MTRIESENDISMKSMGKNWRYRVFRYKDKIYLLDLSTRWFSFMLFLINWLLPMNAYEVDESSIEVLGEKTMKELELNNNNIWIIVGLSALVASVVGTLIKKLDFGKGANVIYVYWLPIVFLIYFTISRNTKKKKLIKALGSEINKKRIRFELSPEKEVDKWKLFYLPGIPVILLLILGILLFGRNIVNIKADGMDYIGYFLGYFIWFAMCMYNVLKTEHLVGATVIIENK